MSEKRVSGSQRRRRAVPPRQTSADLFFQFALLGLAASGFFGLASARSLDWPTVAITIISLILRALAIAGWLRLAIPPRLIALTAGACGAFVLADFYLLSHDLFAATLHGFCFLAALKILTARTRRDYFWVGAVAFVQVVGAGLFSFHASFFGWLALCLLCGIAALAGAEIRAGLARNATVAAPTARLDWRLAMLASAATAALLLIAAGLFLTLPRTARAAAGFFPDAPRLTGYSNIVDLGTFGQIGKDTRPVMHVLSYAGRLPPWLKWRGTALSRFDGRRWSEPPLPATDIAHNGTVEVAGALQRSRRDAGRLLYRVNVNASDTGTLFIGGIPEFINVSAERLVRTAEDSFRVLPVTGDALEYEVSAHPGPALPAPLTTAERWRYLQLPPVDQRIAELARQWAGGRNGLDAALRIESHLRKDFEYRLEGSARGPADQADDPLANFLFVKKRGYCEYFASAMAVMLRAMGTPSRVATGFQNGYYNDVSGKYVVRASDAHAWVEAWVDGRGWLTFDPTPLGVAQAGFLSRVNMYLDAADSLWQQWVVSYDTGHQAALANRLADRLRSLRYGRGLKRDWREWIPAGAARWSLAALAVGLFALAGVWAWPRLWRRTKKTAQLYRIERRGGSAGDGRALYEHMLRAMEGRGYRKPAWFTPLEFARGLPGAEHERVARFTTLYNSVRFGGSAGEAAELARLLREFGKS